jgi:hypothetical protein
MLQHSNGRRHPRNDQRNTVNGRPTQSRDPRVPSNHTPRGHRIRLNTVSILQATTGRNCVTGGRIFRTDSHQHRRPPTTTDPPPTDGMDQS